jgi:CHAT domain-containing protein
MDDKTALIEYFLGENKSLMFLVTRSKVLLYSLPPGKAIEKSIRAYLKILSQPPSGKWEGLLASKRIYKEVFLDSLGKIPESISNLIVIPDGILYYLPFETLVITGRNGSGEDRYLIEEFQVSYAPSSSSLLFLIKEKFNIDISKGLLAFANPSYNFSPFFEKNDNGAYIEALKELYSGQYIDFSPLPYSQQEAQEISKFFPNNKRDIYFRNNAREEIVKNISLKNYRVIHFACHGILDANFPYRSALVLSLDEDMDEDGFLQVREIYNLKMNADLIVLSACQTGRGKLEKWEGILGLPRIFFYAGAKSVVSTLWKVRDYSTAKFMSYFYQSLSQGKTKANAIQLAKMKMMNSRFSHPFYWGSFILYGDYSSKLSFD